jgi:hypothetical protein
MVMMKEKKPRVSNGSPIKEPATATKRVCTRLLRLRLWLPCLREIVAQREKGSKKM